MLESPAAPPARPAAAGEDLAVEQLAGLNSVGLLADIAPAAGEIPAPPPLPTAPTEDLAAEASREQTRNATTSLDCAQGGDGDACAAAPGSGAGAPSPGAPNTNGGGAGSNGGGTGGFGAGNVITVIVNPGPPRAGEFAIGRPIPFAPRPGGPRTSRTLRGFAAALESKAVNFQRVLDTQGLSSSGDPTDVTIETDAQQDRIAALFKVGGSRDGALLEIAFESADPPGGAFQFYDDHFGARSTEVTGTPGGQGDYYLFTSPGVRDLAGLPAGVQFCDCQYLVWGVWGGSRPSGQDERFIELGTWVAGEMSAFQSQLAGYSQPLTATYTGHLIAGVRNGGNIYGAIGGINLRFTFGAGAYTLDAVDIVNFDGTNLQRTTPATQSFGANAYGSQGNFTISGVHPTAGPITAEIAGAFFGPGRPPSETGGLATLSGANYEGHGTYAASQAP
jgi:hypothetical protein